MRLPAPVVTPHLKAILEGILLWSGDTKNQFKLKVNPCYTTAYHPTACDVRRLCHAPHCAAADLNTMTVSLHHMA